MISHKGYIHKQPLLYMTNYILYLCTTNNHTNRESMKEISSVVTVEVTFVAYDIYKQEGGNLFL